MEEEGVKPTVEELVLSMTPEHIPVAKTRFIGHYPNARAIMLGKEMQISKTS